MNNVDRAVLQDQLVNSVIDGMDFKTMWSVLYDFMNESYDKYSDEELKTEVEEYYPELLDSWGSGTRGVVSAPFSCIV